MVIKKQVQEDSTGPFGSPSVWSHVSRRGKKAAGNSFLGPGSVGLLRECIEKRLVEDRPAARLIPRSYYGVWAAIHRAARRIGLDPAIQPCHGLRKYFENAFDDANIDHEKKMMIKGHSAGNRAKHYTDRDMEELRDIYRRAYPFIRLNLSETVWHSAENENCSRKLAELQARLDKQRIPEAKLTVLEDEVEEMKRFRKRLEQQAEG